MTENISITFPDNVSRQYHIGITPAEIARSISPSLEKRAVSALVNETHWDLQWPICTDAKIEINQMGDNPYSLELIRHDFAHVMARAVQELWPETKVTIGPVIERGWYYDFDRDTPFTPGDLQIIEKKMKEIINLRDRVSFDVWDRERAMEHYRENNEPYKLELIEAIPEDQEIKMYWHGDWQDLCRGPHLAHTGQLPADAFKLTSIAGAYWRGDSRNKMLQRIYGIAFRNRKDLKDYLTFLEEAKKRDHRKLGGEMKLFHFQDEAPGMVFWHPDGWTICKQMKSYMSRRQTEYGYQEVNTPAVLDRALWEKSGHWEKFHDHMFLVDIDKETDPTKRISALKPMNCPGHVQIFNKGLKSYRDLPLRISEFGSCTRFEPSGALHGLMRVRGFVQDDAHIFCEESHIEEETKYFIEMLSTIYKDFGFDKFKILFSDRPEVRAGADETWDRAEEALKSATIATGSTFGLNPGEGAFYGPKLEFLLTDSLGREWQCGTLQVDFVLPERLEASFIGRDGNKHRPVMLHRTILGSFERFLGILIENYAGKLPLWLAPTQVVVATIVSDADDFAEEVVGKLNAAGIRAKPDTRNEKIGYKVREHSLAKVPHIFAVGAREVEENTVSVRTLGEKRVRYMTVDEAVEEFTELVKPPDFQN